LEALMTFHTSACNKKPSYPLYQQLSTTMRLKLSSCR
jgi:hypothetical protein